MAKRKENETTPPTTDMKQEDESAKVEPVEGPEVISISDPREEARKRSKEDLQRKRRNLRGGKGGF